jgi:hypothetical protein
MAGVTDVHRGVFMYKAEVLMYTAECLMYNVEFLCIPQS